MIELIENPHGWIRPGLIDGSSVGWSCSWRDHRGWAITRSGARRKVLRWMAAASQRSDPYPQTTDGGEQ
jgi:hypothetical protein